MSVDIWQMLYCWDLYTKWPIKRVLDKEHISFLQLYLIDVCNWLLSTTQMLQFTVILLFTSVMNSSTSCSLEMLTFVANTSNCNLSSPPPSLTISLPSCPSSSLLRSVFFFCPRWCRCWTWVMMLSSLQVSIYQCQKGKPECLVDICVCVCGGGDVGWGIVSG